MVYFVDLIILSLSFFTLSLSSSIRKRADRLQVRPHPIKLKATPDLPSSPAPAPSYSPACRSVPVRREWRALSYDEQADYIRSVKCLARLPSKLLGPSYRRWDDFEYVHCEMRGRVHARALFLPWHRWFLVLYERALQDECNLKGTLPYWNWTLDYQNITQSPIWSSDPIIGFGSNGSFFGPGSDPDDLDAGVVTDGAFARFPIYYPDRLMLQRNFQLKAPWAVDGYYLGNQWYNPNNMDIVMSQPNYSAFIMHLEGNYQQPDGTVLPAPHSIIHTLLGGVRICHTISNSSETFYCHHVRIDQLWFLWQMQDPTNRLYQFMPVGGFPANLDEELDYMGLAPKIKIRDVMNPLVPPLCYNYQ
ncbi:hypothetical protein PCASD_20801 [Puccinia coronata f. sp. avenae]|uniref:Tyrosinase copper-binding domain-containing protein n=1 Tax=Puccinia coronata f. sp. avenae TaxID=200324 RepID=A0A2N5TTG8_9BASI|nr:hypothetical protein PCASD_20801 [Puccinia coronata f. sp. avenae]